MELNYRTEREDLAAAFQWTARLNMHEAVANHFSIIVEGGKRFLVNPNQRHFSQIKSSDILDLDINEKEPLNNETFLINGISIIFLKNLNICLVKGIIVILDFISMIFILFF